LNKKNLEIYLNLGKEGFAICSKDKREVLYVSRQMEHFFGDRANEDILSYLKLSNSERCLKALSKRGRFKTEVESRLSHTLDFIVELNFNYEFIEGIEYLIISAIDISYKKELNSVNKTITSLLERKNEELSVAIEKAEQTAAAKVELFANMSHEIRTPMNGILGMVQLLSGTELNVDQRDMVETIHSCGDSFLTILNDILTISKIESEKIELEIVNFDLHKCIESTADLFSHQVTEQKICLRFERHFEQEHWFRGDVTRIRQIIVNLLSNAIKFTQKGEVSLLIVVEEAKEGKSDIAIHVKDTGMGIPKHAQEKIFKSFSQVDTSTTRKFGGVGLGLAICSNLASLMGGRVGIESKEGEGSTFSLYLNLEVGQSEEKNNSLQKINNGSVNISCAELFPHNILLVEDNLINQKIAIMMLEKLGYKCDLATDGLEALAALKNQKEKKYSMIFMDIQMPNMDGIEATEKIIELYGDDRPKIVAITANAFKEDMEKCFEVGMDGFLAKPVTVDDLKKVLEKFFNLDKLEKIA